MEDLSLALLLPKVSFHLDGFFDNDGRESRCRHRDIGGKGGTANGSSARCFNDEREALLVSRA